MMTKIAVLDDWQGVARDCADWSELEARAEVTFFRDAFASEDVAVQSLAPFDIILALRERTAFPASLIQRLPNLRMFSLTGARAGSIDSKLMMECGVTVCVTGSGGSGYATSELALGLMIAASRCLPTAFAQMQQGGFQSEVPLGYELAGKTLGLVGAGRLGGRMARYGAALEMDVIAWSENLTDEKAAAVGARRVSKQKLFELSDVISVHLVLSDRSRGIVSAQDLARMKTGAVIINTSRGPLIDETALLSALQAGKLVAGLDVYDREPLAADHPLRKLPNVVLTPHLGYVVRESMTAFYAQLVENALAYMDGKPIRLMPSPQ
ncbi:MAG: phosphoglycerate dehydrogenase-like enzyme [Gammaproteobacteria bacterium]|jgi:phosphoglycerate dehydrogenase-like enzyme